MAILDSIAFGFDEALRSLSQSPIIQYADPYRLPELQTSPGTRRTVVIISPSRPPRPNTHRHRRFHPQPRRHHSQTGFIPGNSPDFHGTQLSRSLALLPLGLPTGAAANVSLRHDLVWQLWSGTCATSPLRKELQAPGLRGCGWSSAGRRCRRIIRPCETCRYCWSTQATTRSRCCGKAGACE